MEYTVIEHAVLQEFIEGVSGTGDNLFLVTDFLKRKFIIIVSCVAVFTLVGFLWCAFTADE
jgi:hypothetical protein